MAEPTKLSIKCRRGDTRRHVFTISAADGSAIDISLWGNFRLHINTEREPDANPPSESIVGQLVSDGTDGQVYFTPAGTLAIGTYFYDAEALDNNSERVTFAWGSYIVSQDITK